MSNPSQPTDGPTTDIEFRERLGTLLRRAHGNGVDVTGGWAFRENGPDVPDWGVEIHAVVKRTDAGG